MLKKYFFILFLMVGVFCKAQESDYILGQLVDSTLNVPIPFATIKLSERALGVISNVDGTFKIPQRFKELGEILEISCLGFQTKKINIQDLDTSQGNIIVLRPSAFELTEAVVSAKIKKLSPKQIVRIAVNSISQNYPNKEFGLVGYYRDYQVKNGVYTNLNEALIKVFDKGFGKKNSLYNEYQLLSYDENLNFEMDIFAKQPYDYEDFNKIVPHAKMKNDGGNEFIMLGMHDAIRNYKEESFSFINNMKTDFLDNHRFRLLSTFNYDKESVYQIEITFRDGHYRAMGTIFVGTGDFSIHKLDYALYKLGNNLVVKKKGFDYSGVVNASERFSDGFRKMNSEMIYHIQTEYSRGVGDKMFLNYISFYNKILVQRPAEFASKFTINLRDKSFKIRLNKLPSDLNKIKNRDFKITYKGVSVPIKEFWFQEDERTFVVCPHVGYKKAEDIFKGLFMERDNLQVSDVKYTYGNIKDSEGNKLDERKWEYIHQYREFFTQEVQVESRMIDKDEQMISSLPLDSPKQPISNETLKQGYWKNTPLPILQN